MTIVDFDKKKLNEDLTAHVKWRKLPESYKFGFRLTQGLAGWMAYSQAAWRKKIISEYALYSPIYEIALGRNWKIMPQADISQTNQRKIADFFFYKEGNDMMNTCLLEVKYIKDPQSFSGNIMSDIDKLIEFDISAIRKMKGWNIGSEERIFLIAGMRKHLCSYFSSVPREDRKKNFYEYARKLLDFEPDKCTAAGFLSGGVGNSDARFCIIGFRYQPYWEDLFYP